MFHMMRDMKVVRLIMKLWRAVSEMVGLKSQQKLPHTIVERR